MTGKVGRPGGHADRRATSTGSPGPRPELAQNLAIVLHDLDNRSRAVEADKRSPGGKGYTGLEALLQYVFNQAMAINTYGPLGHILAVDAFVDPICSPYANPQTLANNLAAYGSQIRRCYAWLGPNQPGVNETDPSNPARCVPDPGGAPPGNRGPATTACKLGTSPTSARDVSSTSASGSTPTTQHAREQRARDQHASSTASSPATTTSSPSRASASSGGRPGFGPGQGVLVPGQRRHSPGQRLQGLDHVLLGHAASTSSGSTQSTGTQAAAAPQLPAGAMRRSRGSAFTSPVLIGAVTVLIVLVAVFLAYNANAGLPFVPTQELKVDVANGSDIVIGNDVREGGFRVGLVSEAKPVELPNGQVGAQLTLQIDEAHEQDPG